jgi:hypothetical protein
MVDKKGMVRHMQEGYDPSGKLDTQITELLNE